MKNLKKQTIEIIQSYKELKSIYKTAKVFNCSAPTISAILKRNNIKRNGRSLIDKELKKQICSKAGKAAHADGKLSGKDHWNWKGGKKKHKCYYCNNLVERLDCQVKNKVVCRNCLPKHLSLVNSGANHSKWRGNELEKDCLVCGKHFRDNKESKKFCSNKCFGIYESGANNPNWQGGINSLPYSFGWSSKLRNKIRNRDGNICQICLKTEKENGKKLTVHHINYDKDDHEDFNLITLCNVCHGRTNGNREYWFVELMDIQAFNFIGIDNACSNTN